MRSKTSKGEGMKPNSASKVAVAVVTAIVGVALAAPMAQAATPAPGYTQFAGCPSNTEVPTVTSCLRSEVKSGNFKMGNKNVTIENPIILSGGTDEFLGNFVYNSKGGMPPVKQKVPGGVIGLTGLTWLLEFFGSEALTLYAATELAGQPVFHGLEQIELPIKVHLIHSVLGNNCYVGSTSNPIKLKMNLTTAPELTVDPNFEILHIKKTTYVDKTFTAPGASGCTLTLFGFIPISINGLVNTQSGLPAATGNETTQNIETEIAAEEAVYP
jgi:hypothetical protein